MQRKGITEGGDFFSPANVQPRLTIGAVDDPYEREADAAASRVVDQIHGGNPADTGTTGGGAEIQAKPQPVVRRIQRKPIFESEETPEVQAKLAPDVQRADTDGGTTPSDGFSNQLASSKGSGQPLPEETQTSMGDAFGADFSGVNVHTGSEAAQMNNDIGARAFTHGSDIYFNEGEYDTESRDGQELLAHELTHTVQQGAAGDTVQRNVDANSNVVNNVGPPYKASKNKKAYEINPLKSSPKIVIPSINLPKFKGTRYPSAHTEPLIFTLKKRPKTKQRTNWKERVEGTVRNQVFSKISPSATDDRQVYFLRSKKRRKPFYVFGSIEEIIKESLTPRWDYTGEKRLFEIDHIREMQIGGEDVIGNYEMLDREANNSSGQRIRAEKETKINEALAAFANMNIADLPVNYKQARARGYEVEARKIIWSRRVGGRNLQGEYDMYWKLDDIEQGKHLDKLQLMTATEIEQIDGKRDKDKNELVVFVAGNSGTRRKINLGKAVLKDGEFNLDHKDWFPRFRLKKVKVTENDEEGLTGGYIAGEAFNSKKKPLTTTTGEHLRIPLLKIPGTRYAAKVDSAGLHKSLQYQLRFRGLSPVELEELFIDDNIGFKGHGKISPTIPLIAKAGIEFVLEGDDARIRKVFDVGAFDLRGLPLNILESTLEVFYSSKAGLGLGGQIDFEVKNLGRGTLRGEASMEGGVQLAGEFNLNSKRFDKAAISIQYDSKKDIPGGSPWSVSGEIAIGKKGKIKGVKSLSILLGYENKTFSGAGTVVLDVPGVEGGKVAALYDTQSGAFMISAQLALSEGIPGLNGGEVEFGIAKYEGQEDYAISIGGEIRPKIPGLQGTKLAVSYDDGTIWIKAETSFSKGIVEGDITLGLTNQAVDVDGNPTGEVRDHLVPFGNGQLSVVFGKYLKGTIGAKFTADGDNGEAKVLLNGEIGIPEDVDLSNGPFVDIDKEIIPFPQIDIPIFGVTALGKKVGIFAFIGGGIFFFAKIGPLRLKQLKLNVEDFDPANPSSVEVRGDAALDMPAEAGIRLHLEAGIGAAIIVEVTLSLTGDLTMKLSSNITGEVSVLWSQAGGLELLEAEVGAEGGVDIMGQIGGSLKVNLDLLFKTINLYTKNWDIGEPLYLGSFGQFNYRFPLSMKNGVPEVPSPEKFKYPKSDQLTDSNKRKDMMEGSMKSSHKKLPPKPPGKKEIINRLKQKTPGFGMTWSFQPDKDTRYGYLLDLHMKYGPEAEVPDDYKIDFSFVAPALQPHENKELRQFRDELFELTEVPMIYSAFGTSLKQFRLMKLGEFKKAHWYVSRELYQKVVGEVLRGQKASVPKPEDNRGVSEGGMSNPDE